MCQGESPEVRQVSHHDREAISTFVGLDRELASPSGLLVPEIEATVAANLAGRSPFYEEMQHALFVATRGDRTCARCAALINARYQRAKKEAVGFIGHFAARPDTEAEVRALLLEAESWLSRRGVRRVIAPVNGAAFLGSALLTAAHDEPPIFPFGWDPAYYASYFLAAGYQATYPYWFYWVDFSSREYRAVAERALRDRRVRVRPVSRLRWKEDLDSFQHAHDESFQEEWEFHPHTTAEFRSLFDQFRWTPIARQMLLAEVERDVAGFCWGMPDWNPMMRSFHGKLGPIELVKLLLRANRYQRAGLLAIGVLPAFRGTGVAQSLAVMLYRQYEARGFGGAYYMGVNDVNEASKRFAQAMGGKGRILYHCYDKRLDQSDESRLAPQPLQGE
jgi:ribosomal protein S18 acetylase RimI-like enzyme